MRFQFEAILTFGVPFEGKSVAGAGGRLVPKLLMDVACGPVARQRQVQGAQDGDHPCEWDNETAEWG
jgi:hypothetical protein